MEKYNPALVFSSYEETIKYENSYFTIFVYSQKSKKNCKLVRLKRLEDKLVLMVFDLLMKPFLSTKYFSA